MRRRKRIARVRLRERRPAEIPVTEVLAIYLADLSQRHQRRLQVNRHVAALHVWWADKTLAEINGPNCQAYVKQRTKQRRMSSPISRGRIRSRQQKHRLLSSLPTARLSSTEL